MISSSLNRSRPEEKEERMSVSYSSRYGRSYAIVVGIDEYEHVSPLGFAKNDAKAVAESLGRFGFEKDDVIVLLDRDATREGIRDAYLDFTEDGRMEPDDRLVFFFAGHGHTLTGSRGEVGFLVPYDGHPSESKTLLRWDDLTRNADLISAKHIFFVMDACYGGLAVQRAPSLGSMRFLGDMLMRQARQVLTAGKADEAVADGNGIRAGHSIFTAHLLDGLDGAAATRDGVITANGLMAYVYEKVGHDQYSHQTPHFGYLAGDGDFIFDTSPLDALRSKSGAADAGLVHGIDILVNSAPQTILDGRENISVVDKTKELLSEPSRRIKLDDFVTSAVRRFLDEIDQRHFPAQGDQPTNETFVDRVRLYEKAAADLQNIFILMARWADDDQLPILEKALSRVGEADTGSSGFKIWLDLSWYPITCLIYAAGISALAAKRFDTLAAILNAPVQPQAGSSRPSVPIVVPATDALSEINSDFKRLPGRERNLVPRSEQLFSLLQPPIEDLLFVGRSYEALFDKFETILALNYIEVSGSTWAPPGRFAYKQRRSNGGGPLDLVMSDAEKNGPTRGLLGSGLFGGSQARLSSASEKLKGVLSELRGF